MSDASDIFEQLIVMMLMGEYSLELIPKVEVDEDEIKKAEEMYEEKESN